MEAVILIICVMIVSQTVKDIVFEVFPNKKDVAELTTKIENLEEKYKKIDPDKIVSLMGELKAIKLSTPAKAKDRGLF